MRFQEINCVVHYITASDQKPSNKKTCCCCNSYSEFWQQHQILRIYFMFFLVTGYCNRACIYLIIEIHLEFWVYVLIFQLSNILLIWKFTLTTGLGKYSTKCNTSSTAKCIIISTNIGKTICVGTLWLVQPFQAKWKLHVVMKCYVDAQFWSTW